MERMTLREAAERTSRSITTLRRYIRSGRLHAEKRYGRFGPEYFVSLEDLVAAGLETDAIERNLPAVQKSASNSPALAHAALFDHAVPITLYQELQMKHEQLLVQYGMMRASGIRALELQGEVETRRRRGEELEAEIARLRRRQGAGASHLEERLRKANLELEGRALEIAALKEKVNALEMLTRNSVTNETIDKQFHDLEEQAQRVDRLSEWSESAERWSGPSKSGKPTDH
jgi:hypothetical protein